MKKKPDQISITYNKNGYKQVSRSLHVDLHQYSAFFSIPQIYEFVFNTCDPVPCNQIVQHS
jgi:hypothetical protein